MRTVDPSDDDPLIGQTFADRYQIVAWLGAGGMGTVYRARQLAMDRDVAVKVLPAERSGLSDIQRFHREMKACSRLHHPNCVQVHDFGTADNGLLFLVMELVDGETLEATVRAGPLEARRAARIGAQIAKALGAAHAIGLVHRDIKPANVMLSQQFGETDLVKVVDFGLARAIGGDEAQRDVTETGDFVGTRRYASPEQARGDDVDERTDLYSLGLLLFSVVGGTLPYRGRESLAALPGEALAGAIAALLELDPARRPDAAEALRLLEDVAAAPPTTVTRGAAPRRWAMPAALGVTTLALAALALGVTGGSGRWTRQDPGPAVAPPSTLAVSPSPSDLGPASVPIAAAPTTPHDRPPDRPRQAQLTGLPPLPRPRSDGRHGNTAVLDCPDKMAAIPRMTRDGVTVEPFCLDRTEVTVAAYTACATCRTYFEEPGCNQKDRRQDHPANCLYPIGADTYCHQVGKRLPTVHEWLVAALGEAGRYTPPWESAHGPRTSCGGALALDGTCPVGTHRASDTPQGVHDMLGNVWEWTARRGLTNPMDDERAVCGGGWRGKESSMLWSPTGTPSARVCLLKSPSALADVGFRCAWSPPGSDE